MKSTTIILIILLTCPLFAQIKYVPTDYYKIQEAINNSKDGDTIIVEDGKYYEHISFKGKAIVVASRYYLDNDRAHITNTILTSGFNTQDSLSLVYFINGEDSTSVLSGFTLQNGKGTRMSPTELVGGAILLDKSGATISNNIIKNNSTVDMEFLQKERNAFGGAIESWALPKNKTLIVSQNAFYNNTLRGYRAMGGGIDIAFISGSARISKNKFLNNSVIAKESGYGGGIAVAGAHNDSKVILDNNYISHNNTYSLTGSSKGGGIACYFSAPDILNNIIVYNKTEYPQQYSQNAFGGGIAVHWYKSWMDALPNYICDPYKLVVRIENNTIAYNNDKLSGGGVALRSVGAKLKNNIIGCNFAENDKQIKIEYPDAPQTETRRVIVEYSNVEGGFEGEGNITDFPNFVDEEKWYLKRDLSPCIDSGNPDKRYDDIEDPEASGQACYPALGSVRNDIGAFGGPNSAWTDGIVTDIKNIELQMPKYANLGQNYPNPFNPTTTIKYQLSANLASRQAGVKSETSNGFIPSGVKGGIVQLNIYDILGCEVVTLVNERQKPGNYEVVWNANNHATGIYFYELKIHDFIETKKMIYLK